MNDPKLKARAERHRERAYADIRARVESGAIPLSQAMDEMRAACARADRIALGLPSGPVDRMSVAARRRTVRDMASAGTTPARIARELGLPRHYVETVLATPVSKAKRRA